MKSAMHLEFFLVGNTKPESSISLVGLVGHFKQIASLAEVILTNRPRKIFVGSGKLRVAPRHTSLYMSMTNWGMCENI